MCKARHLDLPAMALAAITGLLTFVLAIADTAAAYDLLTAEEYAERSPRGATRSITVLATEGPEIIVHAPETSGDLRSPLDFDIEFRARDAAPVMGSLILEYDLGLFWKDVTDRLVGHTEITDNRIISRDAELPAGDHHLRLSISDLAGKTTTTKMVLTVAE